jgi:pimeloyl-ACP methyl ester carboxylesterase
MSFRQCLAVLVCLVVPAVALEQDQFFDSAGVKIHYIEQGTGDPVLLLHGQSNNVDLWSSTELLQALSAAGYHVVAFDARGHGKSDKPHDPKQYGRQMALDAVRLMDHLQIRRVHIVGFSMGSTTVSLLLTMQPDRFLTATLIAGAGRFRWTTQSDHDTEQQATELERDCVSRTAILSGLQLNESRPSDDEIKRRSAACLSNQNVDRFAMAALVRGRRDQVITPAQVAAVRIPTLGLVGSLDPLAAEMRDLQILRPDMKLLVVEGATHGRGEPQGILHQAATKGALLEFLASHRQAAVQ